MIVDVSIKPEIRGELDALKLSRLLLLINIVSATVNTSNCLAAVSSCDPHHQPLVSQSTLSLNDHNLEISDLISHLHELEAGLPDKVG
jgi:hypothetical protein